MVPMLCSIQCVQSLSKVVACHLTANDISGKISQQTGKNSQQSEKYSQQTGKISQQIEKNSQQTGKNSQQTENFSQHFFQNNQSFFKSSMIFSINTYPRLALVTTFTHDMSPYFS